MSLLPRILLVVLFEASVFAVGVALIGLICWASTRLLADNADAENGEGKK